MTSTINPRPPVTLAGYVFQFSMDENYIRVKTPGGYSNWYDPDGLALAFPGLDAAMTAYANDEIEKTELRDVSTAHRVVLGNGESVDELGFHWETLPSGEVVCTAESLIRGMGYNESQAAELREATRRAFND